MCNMQMQRGERKTDGWKKPLSEEFTKKAQMNAAARGALWRFGPGCECVAAKWGSIVMKSSSPQIKLTVCVRMRGALPKRALEQTGIHTTNNSSLSL